MERNVSAQIATTVVMVHMMMEVPRAVVRAFRMEPNASMEIVNCVALMATIGTRLERITVVKNRAWLTGQHVFQVRVVGSVAAAEPTMVVERFVAVNACRVDQSAVI
jgi:hypothetical protein